MSSAVDNANGIKIEHAHNSTTWSENPLVIYGKLSCIFWWWDNVSVNKISVYHF